MSRARDALGRAGGEPAAIVLLLTAAALGAVGIAATIAALTPERAAGFTLPLALPPPTRAVTLLALLGAAAFPRRFASARVARAAFAAALTLAVTGVSLDATFAPSGDFRERWEAEYAPTHNLTYGTELAASLRAGRGFVYESGSVETYRMPGYPLLVALAGVVSGTPADDGERVARATIWAQALLTALAVGVFVLAAGRRLGRVALLAVALLLAFLPANVQYTQVDSVVFALGLLATAAVVPFLDPAAGRGPPLRTVLLLHGSFALFYAFRTEVVLAWAAVSLIVHWRRWRHLALPAALFLALAGGFGAYTATHGNEFTLGTNNLGHVAFVGLWQAPGHDFAWEPTDESYDAWISAHGHEYRRPGTNGFAVREVLRFYATYPGYVAGAVADKWFGYFERQFAATITPFRAGALLRDAGQRVGAWVLFGAVALGLVVGYRRRATVLLGWGFLFTLPPFLFLQSDERFTRFVSASLVVAAVPLLLDRRFYAALFARRLVATGVLAALVVVWLVHGSIEGLLLESDGFRYWTPLLDPDGSTLSVRR